jgi:alkanesulfonate monooxygenase SsuD/methylene tetrahydromethanopterin reductase-like flavin-dependent oxidoreductase (luciferase family)
MTVPKLGYLCLSENPSAEAGRALVRQFVLAREAERMGYDDIWLGEQHGDMAWPQGAITALLGFLAGVTSKARIGSMCLLPALQQPLPLAETLATLDLLTKGRLHLGVASGAAFPTVLQAHGLTPDQARSRMHEVLGQTLALLAGEAQPSQDLALVPGPVQARLPVWLAADDEASLRHAASQGWGLMAAATHSPARVARAVQLYTAASGGRAPELVLARFACSADTAEEAQAIARPYFEGLAQRAAAAGWGADAGQSSARDAGTLMAQSLVGSHAEVARQFSALGEGWGATRVAIVPTSGQFDTHKHILAAFVDEVRPLLED